MIVIIHIMIQTTYWVDEKCQRLLMYICAVLKLLQSIYNCVIFLTIKLELRVALFLVRETKQKYTNIQ